MIDDRRSTTDGHSSRVRGSGGLSGSLVEQSPPTGASASTAEGASAAGRRSGVPGEAASAAERPSTTGRRPDALSVSIVVP
ncbi:MAG TPA: hypothetical protein VJ957_02245, partial [Longimicrobiales bacterium]|nr:hypothetical protein [Longimicrobiales bacterium]